MALQEEEEKSQFFRNVKSKNQCLLTLSNNISKEGGSKSVYPRLFGHYGVFVYSWPDLSFVKKSAMLIHRVKN